MAVHGARERDGRMAREASVGERSEHAYVPFPLEASGPVASWPEFRTYPP